MIADCTIHRCEQRTPEWYQARVGRLTGSAADAVIAVRKKGNGELAIRTNLRRRLVAERLTRRCCDELTFLPADMLRGVELEPQAFAAYEALTGQLVQRVGFVSHNQLAAGCSPDGYVGPWIGTVELKCPKSTTHLEYLQGCANAGIHGVPEEYRGQIIHTLWLTGAEWCDFVSFDDRYPHPLQLYVKRVHRADVDIAAYELAAQLFLTEVETELAAVAAEAVTS